MTDDTCVIHRGDETERVSLDRVVLAPLEASATRGPDAPSDTRRDGNSSDRSNNPIAPKTKALTEKQTPVPVADVHAVRNPPTLDAARRAEEKSTNSAPPPRRSPRLQNKEASPGSLPANADAQDRLSDHPNDASRRRTYTIHRIIDHRKATSALRPVVWEYRVKWYAYRETATTWEPTSAIPRHHVLSYSRRGKLSTPSDVNLARDE